MAHRLRGHRVNSTNPNTAGSTSTSGTTASSAGKRKRDVLQDISEEHGGNGSSSRQHAAAAGSSNRRSLAPRRPSPMAPARRASVRVRRSRRLSEQPASAAGRAGGRTTSVAGVGAGAGGSSGTGRGGGRGSGGDGSGGDGSGAEGDDGGMSCDEDLEGMVVDLSFDGVADDAAWRDRRQSAPPALQAATVDGDLVGSTGVVEGAREGGKSQSEALSGGSRGDTTSTAAASATSVSGNTVNSSLNVQVQTAPIAQESGRVAKTARAGNRDVGSRGGSVGGNTSTRASSDVGTGSTLSRSSSLSSVSTVEDQQMEDSFERSVTGAAASTGLKRSAAVAELEIGLARKPAAASSSDASCKASASSAAATAAEYAEKISEERMLAAAGARTPLPAGVEDIDAGVVDAAESHLQNAEYVVEHAAFLRAQERRNRPGAYIGGKQKDMRHNMRSVLVDWIVEVCDQFKLSSRTLFQVRGLKMEFDPFVWFALPLDCVLALVCTAPNCGTVALSVHTIQSTMLAGFSVRTIIIARNSTACTRSCFRVEFQYMAAAASA